MLRFSISAIATFLIAGFVAAQVPSVMNYQGRLMDNTPSQDPITDILPIEFRIYGSAMGQDLVWSESWGAVDVVDGIFSVLLGSNGAPILTSVFTGAAGTGTDRYLEIVIDGETLSPRQQLGLGGWAAQAQRAAEANQSSDLDCVACVDAADIAVGGVGSQQIQDGSITGTDILNGTITTSDILDNSITAADVAAGAIGASEIATNAVGASEIATGAVTPIDLTISPFTLTRSISTASSATQCTSFNTFNFCALSRVQMVNVINSGTNSWCQVNQSGSSWQICARSNNTTTMNCEMRCF